MLGMNILRPSLNLPDSKTVSLKPAKYHYNLIAEQVDSSFWQDVYKGARAAAAKVDAVVDMTGSEKYSPDHSAELIRIATAARLDGIATCVVDPQLCADAINGAISAGIPVVTLENDADKSGRQCYIGVNSYSLGQSFGQLAAGFETKGRIVILVSTDQKLTGLSEGQIISGLREYLVQYPNLVLSIIEINRASSFPVENAVRKLLIENQSPVSTIISLNVEDTLRVVESVAEYGRMNDVSILCYQENANILEYVKSGLIKAILATDPYQIGYDSIMALDELKNNTRTNEYVPSKLVTIDADNIESYYGEEEAFQHAMTSRGANGDNP
jgi:ribose transport system substrate-binding protein